MRDLNPSPGVWRVLASAGAIEVEGDMTPVLDAEAVDYDGSVKFDIHNPDDAIVIRYAGELYRRARAVQVERETLDETRGWRRHGPYTKLLWAERALGALLDEMRREAGS